MPRSGDGRPQREPHGSRGGSHRGGGHVFIGGSWWDPWFYGGYDPYWGYGWGWRGWWWPWGPGGVIYDGPYHGGRGSGYGALDTDVWPGEAQIYVDGEMVGTADDFDGFPRYLWLPRGTYDVVIYLPGFETIARQYSIYDGLVIDVEDRMQRGESIRPEDLPATSTVHRDDRLQRNAEREEAARRHEEWRRRQDEADMPPGPGTMAPPGGQGADMDHGNAGHMHLVVSPSDASVYLDGNFVGTGREIAQLSAGVVVAPGSHRLEVVRPGYRAQDLDFDSAPGEDVQLQVNLDED